MACTARSVARVPTIEQVTDDALSPFDSAQFRKVLGHFPTGVTIVTGMAGDIPAGFTIGSFTSVSLDPPLVGVPADGQQRHVGGDGPGRQVLRQRAARRPGRRCAGASPRAASATGASTTSTWTHSPTGCPILEGVGAWIDCTVEHQFELGDHYLVVGKVVDLDHHADPHTPLVFYKGALGGFLAAD